MQRGHAGWSIALAIAFCCGSRCRTKAIYYLITVGPLSWLGSYWTLYRRITFSCSRHGVCNREKNATQWTSCRSMFKTSDEAFPTIYNQALIKVTDGILREGWGRAPAMKEWSAGLFTRCKKATCSRPFLNKFKELNAYILCVCEIVLHSVLSEAAFRSRLLGYAFFSDVLLRSKYRHWLNQSRIKQGRHIFFSSCETH